MKSIIIGIAGGTGSGKSTFTNRLKDEFKDDVAVLYHDNYYRDQSHITFEERVKTNYDHPDAIETDLLIEHIRQLKEGKSIEDLNKEFEAALDLVKTKYEAEALLEQTEKEKKAKIIEPVQPVYVQHYTLPKEQKIELIHSEEFERIAAKSIVR